MRNSTHFPAPLAESLKPLVITVSPAPPVDQREVEICEHKGIGHPDTIVDGACEAAARALAAAYLATTGAIRHHNLDKGLLIAGHSTPRFGGGTWDEPARLIVCGRAAPLPGGPAPGEIVREAARRYLADHIRCDADRIGIEAAVRDGSPNLDAVFTRGAGAPLANDTSFGAGYSPLSRLERTVLAAASHLRSADFRSRFPAAGDDYKIMGLRRGDAILLTIALAFVDRSVRDVAHYFALKREIRDDVVQNLGGGVEVKLNALDDPEARDERGLYLTVSGLSAEMGDDGQAGRGNRVNGLISPYRPMSLEAAAGKNVAAHVGKLYNVLAELLAADLHRTLAGIPEINLRLVSTIGSRIDRPQLIQVELAGVDGVDARQRAQIAEIVDEWLGRRDKIVEMILRDQVRLF